MKFYKFLFSCLLGFCWVQTAFAAEQKGVLSQVQSKRDTVNASTANLGPGMGTDLRAIASPKKTTTATGFPAGTLPFDGTGGSASTQNNSPAGRVVFSGEPLDPIIGAGLVGATLDKVCAIADHVGFRIVRNRFDPNALDSAYSFSVIRGGRRISTLYFDRGLKLLAVN